MDLPSITFQTTDRKYHRSLAIMKYVNSSKVNVPFFQVSECGRIAHQSNHLNFDPIHQTYTLKNLLF